MMGILRFFAYLIFIGLAMQVAGCSTAAPTTSDPGPDWSSAQNDRELYFAVIKGLQSAGQSQAALAYLDDYDKRYPGDINAKLLRANALLSIGEGKQAERLFREVIGTGAVSAGHNGLGKVYAARQNWAEAIRDFSVAAQAEPTNAKILNNLGFAMLMGGRIIDAYTPLARAAELQPADEQIRNNLLLAEYWGKMRPFAVARIRQIADHRERNAVWKFVSGWETRSK